MEKIVANPFQTGRMIRREDKFFGQRLAQRSTKPNRYYREADGICFPVRAFQTLARELWN